MVPEAADSTGGGSQRRLVVDRWEGDLAVVQLEDGSVLDLPRWLLPPGAREGHVVIVETSTDGAGFGHMLRIDPEATEAARAEAGAVLARLRSRDPGGDLVL
jgi:hypothetical protein